MEQQKLLTTKEVAEQLNIYVWKVQELARTGFLRAVKVGERTQRFTQTEVDRFVKDNMSEKYNVRVEEE